MSHSQIHHSPKPPSTCKDVSPMPNSSSQDKIAEQVKDSLGKITKAVEESVLYSNDECKDICEKLRNLPEDQRDPDLWDECACCDE